MDFTSTRKSENRIGAKSRVATVLVALLVVASVFVTPAIAAGHNDSPTDRNEGPTDAETLSASTSAANTFSGCRNKPISQPGTYNLTGGVTNSNQQYCINITADKVVLDGMGHTLQGVGGSGTSTPPVGIHVTGQQVIIKNITIEQWQTGVAYRNGSSHIQNSQITDISLDGVTSHNSTVELGDTLVTADDDGVQASNSELTIFTSRITNENDTDLQRGVRVNDDTHFVMTKSTIENAAITGVLVNTHSMGYLWSNTIVDSEIGVKYTSDSYSTHFTDNVIRGSDRHAVELDEGSNVTKFVNNTLLDTGQHGLLIESSYANVTKSSFVNIGESGVVVGPSARAGKTKIHETNFDNVSNYGVLNRNQSAVVNATGNYWGGPSGPSSNSADSDAPFTDPKSGVKADGAGVSVSEGSTAGVSNVHFDPFTKSPHAPLIPTDLALSEGIEETTKADSEADQGASGDSPGFTPLAAAVALLAFALLAARRPE